jgi:hypothetical protein
MSAIPGGSAVAQGLISAWRFACAMSSPRRGAAPDFPRPRRPAISCGRVPRSFPAVGRPPVGFPVQRKHKLRTRAYLPASFEDRERVPCLEPRVVFSPPERRDADRRCCPPLRAASSEFLGVKLALPLASTAAWLTCSVALAVTWPTCWTLPRRPAEPARLPPRRPVQRRRR